MEKLSSKRTFLFKVYWSQFDGTYDPIKHEKFKKKQSIRIVGLFLDFFARDIFFGGVNKFDDL